MNGSTIELRTNGESGLTLEGYASTFGVWYPIGVGVDERMRSGSFKRSLAEDPAVALRVEHSALPLAHTKGGTLQLSEDRTGLLTVASLNPRDPDVQSLQAKAENSPLQMSFAFRCNKDSWNEDRSRREVVEAGLHKGDVSIVCYGANEATSMSISARAEASSLEERRLFAERIRGYTGGPKWGLTPAAEEPRGRSQIAVPAVRSYVEIARNRAAGGNAKAPRLIRNYLPVAEAEQARHRTPRYLETARHNAARARVAASRARAVPKVARRSLVLSPFGPDWEIGNAGALHKAILQVEIGHAKGPNEDAIKAWIAKRGDDLGTAEHVPKGWRNPAALAAYVESHDPADTAPSVGGQE
jgi:HK97 family phage prohead protease